MKDTQGFTLLELLMVVVIIAILAAIAVPQYLRTVERSRMSEALTMLSSIRQSEIRFRAETGAYTATIAQLDLGTAVTDFSGTPRFDYSIGAAAAGPPPTFMACATRNASIAVGGSCVAGYVIRIDQAGNLLGRDCQSTTCP